MNLPSRSWRFALIAVVIVAAAAFVVSMGRLPQDSAYHSFADTRSFFGVSNFLNVASNVPFLLFGVLGATYVLSRRGEGVLRPLRPSYLVFFIASALVAVGSGYYHWRPDNHSLVWDRLPMAFAFMAFLSVILGEHLDPEMGRRLLAPLLALGLVSVGWWWLTEARGAGDLRPYVLVQFLPLLLIPMVVALFPSRLSTVGLIWAVLGMYCVAKLLEQLDRPLFELVGVSGHTLKHLAAGSGVYLMALAVRRRRLGARSSPELKYP